jgi:hypothetical protein
MAYAILTRVESMAGGRKKAAKMFAVDVAILNKLGDLTANRGDAMSARKFDQGTQLRSMSRQKEQWIDDLIRRLIVRMGERAAGVPDKHLLTESSQNTSKLLSTRRRIEKTGLSDCRRPDDDQSELPAMQPALFGRAVPPRRVAERRG